MIRFMNALCCSMLVATIADAQTATLKMRFVIDGAVPPIGRIMAAPAFAPPGGPLIDERLIADPASKGIKNVVVYVYTGRGGSKLDPVLKDGSEHLLTMTNARFAPHILIAQAGDTIKIVDRGPNRHSPNLHFFANKQLSFVIPPGRPERVSLERAEPGPIPIDCNIHPWMRAYVVVLEHPYAASSDSEGNLSIEWLPANTSLTFQVWHEAGRIDRVTIAGEKVEWPRGRWDVDLAAGVNDLGDVLISASSLNPD